MTKKGGRQNARGGGVGNRAAAGGEMPAGFFPSIRGAKGDPMAEGLSNFAAAGAAAESMGFPPGAGHGAAPPGELLAQMFGAGEGEVGLGPAAAAAAPDDGVDKSRWHILYPAYLDKKKSVAGGRRVSLGVAVQEPRVEEMKKICDHLQIPAAIEYVRNLLINDKHFLDAIPNPSNEARLEVCEVCRSRSRDYIVRLPWKRYPRDWLFSRGRLRVQLRNSTSGALHNQEVPNKKVLLRRMGELIPQLKSRSSAGVTAVGGATSSSSSGKKKKK